QRSRASGVFENQIGSPVRMRTYDPLVNSAGEKCCVFSDHIWLQVHSEDAKALLGSTKLMLLCSASAVRFLAYFCCCNVKCVASCCSCRHSCARHERIFPRIGALHSGDRMFKYLSL